MKKFPTLLLFISFSLIFACQKTSTIYLVRHAEKTDTSRDPDLSETGQKRAERLAGILSNENIKHIYSTNFKRTRQTAAPLSSKQGVEVLLYAQDTLNAFADGLRKLEGNALVVGHSNSTLSLMDAMGIKYSISKIEESDYSNLFKIRKKGKRFTGLEELKF